MAGASDTNPTAAHREPTAFERRLHQVCGASPHVTAHGSTDSLSLKSSTLQATKAIPAGKVTTYGAVADVLNSAPRAVGQVSLQLATSVMLLLASCA